jgi:hypothetical protein
MTWQEFIRFESFPPQHQTFKAGLSLCGEELEAIESVRGESSAVKLLCDDGCISSQPSPILQMQLTNEARFKVRCSVGIIQPAGSSY